MESCSIQRKFGFDKNRSQSGLHTANFTPSLFAELLKLCQAAWGLDTNSPFQVQSQIPYWTEVWTQQLQNIHLALFKQFLCSFRCMLRVIVLLENKSYPQS